MSSENPQVALEALSESEREIFDLYNTPDEIETIKVETLQIETQANNYCRTDGVTFGQKALLGNTLYTWWQRVEICGNPGIQIDNVRVLDAEARPKHLRGHTTEMLIRRRLTQLAEKRGLQGLQSLLVK